MSIIDDNYHGDPQDIYNLAIDGLEVILTKLNQMKAGTYVHDDEFTLSSGICLNLVLQIGNNNEMSYYENQFDLDSGFTIEDAIDEILRTYFPYYPNYSGDDYFPIKPPESDREDVPPDAYYNGSTNKYTLGYQLDERILLVETLLNVIPRG